MSRRTRALEAIAYGADVSPSERLRALELLGQERPEPPRPDLTAMSDRDLELAVDDLTGEDVVADALTDGSRYPRMSAAIKRAVEERAATLADVDRLEAEVERRAQELALELYVNEGWRDIQRSLDGSETPPAGTEYANGTPEPFAHPDNRTTSQSVTAPEGIDMSAGWGKPKRKRRNS